MKGRAAGLAAALAILVSPAAAGGENAADAAPTDLRSRIELPSHAALIDIVTAPDTALAPFTTDGCSGGLSASWRVVADLFPGFAEAHEGAPPWEACCETHDRAYHDAGGARDPAASYAARLTADSALRQCVIDEGAGRTAELARHYGVTEDRVSAAYDAIAVSMFGAVRFGGGPCSGLPWRWGYGFPHCFPRLP